MESKQQVHYDVNSPEASHQSPDRKVSSSMHLSVFLGTISAPLVVPTSGA